MHVAVIGRNKKAIEDLLRRAGFSLVESDPQMVVSFGGDGTLMRAEAIYPGIPKIILKDSMICKKCSSFSNEEVLKKVSDGRYVIEALPKLEVEADGKKLSGMNDIIVHNKDSRHAIRYRIKVGGKDIGHEIIGDGIVVATPFGSTAYFKSITDSFFEVSIGLAFNNSKIGRAHV